MLGECRSQLIFTSVLFTLYLKYVSRLHKSHTPSPLFMVKVSFSQGHNFRKYIFAIVHYTLKPYLFLLRLSL